MIGVFQPTKGGTRRLAAGVCAAALVAVTFGTPALKSGSAGASSHREAPLIAADPAVDNTDTYAFVSPDRPDTVTFLANWSPFQEPNGGPNFYSFAEGARYNINIDNTGDGAADITYRWTFTNRDTRGTDTFLYNNGAVTSLDDPNLLFKQSYTLERITHGRNNTQMSNRVPAPPGTGTVLVRDGIAAPSFTGKASMPDYGALRSQAVRSIPGGQTFAGQAADPFFLDLRVFDLLYGTDLKSVGQNTLAGFNVNSLAIQVPKSEVVLNGDASRNPVIGVWSTTDKQTLTLSPGKATPTGKFVQVSRLGNPLINEVISPAGLKDAFNALDPSKDATVAPLVARVKDPEVPKLLQAIYGLQAPPAPRNDLVEVFLTGVCVACGPIQADLNAHSLNMDAKTIVPSEMLRLNTSIAPTASPNRLGVLANDLQGFPNGRRLTDDVVDIELQVLAGATPGNFVAALASGDGVNSPANPVGTSFPYLSLPNRGAVNRAGSDGVNIGAGANQAKSPSAQSGTATGPSSGNLLGDLLSSGPSTTSANSTAAGRPSGPPETSEAASSSDLGGVGSLLRNLLGG